MWTGVQIKQEMQQLVRRRRRRRRNMHGGRIHGGAIYMEKILVVGRS
jgi:hypothetical protein